VRLIVYCVVFMIAGDLAAYFIGLITEEALGGQVSLIVFLTLYALFSVLMGFSGACGVDDGTETRRTREVRNGMTSGRASCSKVAGVSAGIEWSHIAAARLGTSPTNRAAR
jgi:hypothetical protein